MTIYQYMSSQVWLINRTIDQQNLLIVCYLMMHLRHPSLPSYMDKKHGPLSRCSQKILLTLNTSVSV